MGFPADLDPTDPKPDDVLKLAFAVWVSRLIANADGVLDLSEIRLLTSAFPNALLQCYGLMNDLAEYTELYHASYRQAMRVLPESLTLAEKLDLVTVFHRFCMADEELKQAELLVLREAAEALGVDVRQLSEHLHTLRA